MPEPNEQQQPAVDTLSKRVYALADRVTQVELDMATLKGHVSAAHQSIDRLTATTATSDQVTAVSTILTLKLDHLLEKHFSTQRQINRAMALVVLLFFGGVAALAYVAIVDKPAAQVQVK